ncbi:hypothetical protein AN958_02262 [Leucoagaricus sp. SymC.cos]|nr:hypothetical protein AN958_02262 [Leucoagaricus sp. SymC.cos]
MFDTITVYGSSGRTSDNPIDWLTTRDGLRTTTDECLRLSHQLTTLYSHRDPTPLRRAKHLKIFVSELFRLNSPNRTRYASGIASFQRDLQSTVRRLRDMLPTIIKMLGNLKETTLYLSSHEPDDFIRSLSEALLVPPHLDTITVNFLDQKATRVLPIVSSPRLKNLKISWPIGEPDPFNPTMRGMPVNGSSSIYLAVMNTAGTLRRLELSAKRRLGYGGAFRMYRFTSLSLSQLEELVLENVPLKLEGDVAAQMTGLRSLRIGGYDCFDCDPYVGIFTSLKNARKRLDTVGVDVVGEALVEYLGSYEGLEKLVLKLGQDANDFCLKDICDGGLRYHGESLKVLEIDIPPSSDFRLAWFFPCWAARIRWLTSLENLKVATSLNLLSQFDAPILVRAVLDIVAQMPTLQRVTIRHIHEESNASDAEHRFGSHAIGHPPLQLVKPLRVTPSCLVALKNFRGQYQVVLSRGGGIYGSLRMIPFRE